jgi:uncharacterized protein YndB with AHSA1/START domain
MISMTQQKQKYQLEFVIRSSPKILYNFISTADGLGEWFADDVTINSDGTFTFRWDKSTASARIMSKKDLKMIRFKWLDDEESESFFEFEIIQHDITSDVGLIITDFGAPDELKENTLLWNSQVNKLMKLLGS